ncbi:MAG: DUF1501 domain-containing protein [Deltaproteobacteria bacterium]|nr:DUF1501 domain-containing protein [Deltaproteobacteria bacterium]
MSTESRSSITLSRRSFIGGMAGASGLLAPSLLCTSKASAAAPLGLHHPAKARSVIWLYMEGGPSACDTFDPKPELTKHAGQKPSQEIDVFFGSPGPLMASPFAFKQHGQSGAWVSELFPHVAKQIDRVCFLKSCVTDSPNHGPAMYQMNTGFQRPGFPSMGAWVLYGRGSDNRDLPGFVVFPNARGSKGGPANWSNGFLPGDLQATTFRSGPSPILNLRRPDDMTAPAQRAMLDLAARMNARHAANHAQQDERLTAGASSLELAYRMQTAGRNVAALNDEPEHIRRLYGMDNPVTRPFAEKCLMARRLVEKGVRFVQVYCNDEWDSHNGLRKQHGDRAAETDQPTAALLADLAQRGLLDQTIVVWGGEFGRMPVSEQSDGRDHNPHGFLVWMAGGGIKPGISYGQTDEIGFKAVEKPVSVHDLHATLMHQLGFDHERLTFHHDGRDYRLTDLSGRVITEVI